MGFLRISHRLCLNFINTPRGHRTILSLLQQNEESHISAFSIHSCYAVSYVFKLQ